MSKARGSDIVSTAADLVVDAISIYNLPEINGEVMNLTKAVDGATIAFTISDTGKHRDTFINYLNTYDNPEDTINELERNFKTLESDSNKFSFIKGLYS